MKATKKQRAKMFKDTREKSGSVPPEPGLSRLPSLAPGSLFFCRSPFSPLGFLSSPLPLAGGFDALRNRSGDQCGDQCGDQVEIHNVDAVLVRGGKAIY